MYCNLDCGTLGLLVILNEATFTNVFKDPLLKPSNLGSMYVFTYPASTAAV